MKRLLGDPGARLARVLSQRDIEHRTQADPLGDPKVNACRKVRELHSKERHAGFAAWAARIERGALQAKAVANPGIQPFALQEVELDLEPDASG
ncbi:MAG TPA: hypothetical protein VE093_05655 [Polyangiaceae bacterium]|nr:hypothetical protein [Polyangiaceae bacterium]